MKREKAGKDLFAFDVAADERLKDLVALRAGILSFNSVVCVGLTQRLAAALHLRSADGGFRLCDDSHKALSF